MAKLLLSIRVLGAILLIGPVTIAASLFPRYARQRWPTDPTRNRPRARSDCCTGSAGSTPWPVSPSRPSVSAPHR